MLQSACVGGEGEGQFVGIECLVGAVKALVQLAVFAVTKKGMAGVGELGPDLMCTAGDQLAFHQGKTVPGGKGAVIGLTGSGTGLGGIGDEDPVLLGVLEKIAFQRAVPGLGGAFDDGQVPLIQFPVFDLLIHDPEGFGSLGGDDDAAGIPVDAVAKGGCEGVFFPGAPLPLLVEIGLDMIDEGAAVFGTVVGVNGNARTLIHQQDVVILVDDGQLGNGYGEVGVVFPGLVEKFVIDIQLEHITLVQPGIPLHALAPQLDALDADIFLGQGGGEKGDGLGKETVQALACVVRSYDKFFHQIFPVFSLKWRLISSVNSWAAL